MDIRCFRKIILKVHDKRAAVAPGLIATLSTYARSMNSTSVASHSVVKNAMRARSTEVVARWSCRETLWIMSRASQARGRTNSDKSI